MMTSSFCLQPLQKEESMTLTEASSEINCESISLNQWRKEDGTNPLSPPNTTNTNAEDDNPSKKDQNRVKYRKLKQKLNSMGFNHEDKCVVNKDFSSPKKQRVMKLAIDFQKQIKVQNRDYFQLEVTCKQILKIVECKNQLDLHLIRQSRLIPAYFQLLQKVPSLHRNEFLQVQRTVQIGLRIIYAFASIGTNRDYLVMTNRLNGLISLISWILGKEEKKTSGSFYGLQTLCFKLVNLLLLHKAKGKESSILSISNITVQLIVCSQIFKRIKFVILEQLYSQESPTQTQLIGQMLRFMLFVLRKSQPRLNPIFSLCSSYSQNEQQMNNQSNSEQPSKFFTSSLDKLIEFVIPFQISYFILLVDSEESQNDYPCVTENHMNLALKILNCCFQLSFQVFKKVITELEKDSSMLNTFLSKIHTILVYCKREFEESSQNGISKTLLNQIILLLGHLAVDNQALQKKISEYNILEIVFDLPVQYMMDMHLKQIITPTVCCLIFQNKANLNCLLKDNCPQPIIKFLKKQIQSKPLKLSPSLGRKNSTTSLMSVAVVSQQYNTASYETQRLNLQMRFPQSYWELLCSDLQRHV